MVIKIIALILMVLGIIYSVIETLRGNPQGHNRPDLDRWGREKKICKSCPWKNPEIKAYQLFGFTPAGMSKEICESCLWMRPESREYLLHGMVGKVKEVDHET